MHEDVFLAAPSTFYEKERGVGSFPSPLVSLQARCGCLPGWCLYGSDPTGGVGSKKKKKKKSKGKGLTEGRVQRVVGSRSRMADEAKSSKGLDSYSREDLIENLKKLQKRFLKSEKKCTGT